MVVCLDTSYLVDLLAGESSAREFAEDLAEPSVVSAVFFYEMLFGATGKASPESGRGLGTRICGHASQLRDLRRGGSYPIEAPGRRGPYPRFGCHHRGNGNTCRSTPGYDHEHFR